MQGHATVEGAVVGDDSGQPISDFEIRPWGGDFVRVVDAEGRFRLTDVQAGDNTGLYVRAPGYTVAKERLADVRENDTITGLTIRLRAAAIVEGHVVDSSGLPVSGARIFLGSIPSEHSGGSSLARTDAEGFFRLDTLAPGTHRLAGVHSSHGLATTELVLTAGRVTNTQIVLSLGGQVEGYVTSAGQPLAGMDVSVKSRTVSSKSAMTDQDGFYSIAGIPAEDVTITSIYRSEETFRRLTREGVVEDGQVTVANFDFVLGTATIEGHIISSDMAITRAWVGAQMLLPDGNQEHNDTSADETGYYVFEGVPAGSTTLSIEVTFEDGTEISRDFEAVTTDGQTTRMDVDMASASLLVDTAEGL
jgi:protocatechuate 3,4-dioxygenase beta subunit